MYRSEKNANDLNSEENADNFFVFLQLLGIVSAKIFFCKNRKLVGILGARPIISGKWKADLFMKFDCIFFKKTYKTKIFNSWQFNLMLFENSSSQGM